MIPAYRSLAASGELRRRAEQARTVLSNCELCPRRCGADRLSGRRGRCNTGARALVSSYGPHFGEEKPLVGRYGSGTVFFANCNLSCVFCQNHDISQGGVGEEVSAEELARIMLSLQARGCHNVNLVSPTHVVPQILDALDLAAARGLDVPLVYNTGGYDSLDTLALLDGVVDIYMPDMKYAGEEVARDLSGVAGYPAANQAAVKEMHRQVGDLEVDESGIATRGLLVRHLVLPHGLAGTPEVARFLSREVSPRTYTNVMGQYRPCHKAPLRPKLSRGIYRSEYQQALDEARDAGLERLDGEQRALARIV